MLLYIAVIAPIPEAVLDDVDYDIWGEIRPLIEEEFGRLTHEVVNKLKTDVQWSFDYIRDLEIDVEKYCKKMKEISKVNLRNLSNENLYKLHNE